MTCITGHLFYHFLAPLGTPGGAQGSKHSKNLWFFNIFKIGPRPSKVTSGRPKTPPGPHFFLRAAEGGPSGRPKSLSAPPGIPFGAQGGANGPPGASKRRPFQVKVFKKRYCFPWLLQTLFFGNVSLAPAGSNICSSKI